MADNKKKRILTGDRPTGPLHIGHYVGSLANRNRLQYEYDTFIIIADVQALSTNFDRPEKLSQDVRQVALDNLSVGIDPEISTIFVQSMVPEIAELTILYSMLTTVSRLRRNPTIKEEIAQYGYGENLTYGFLGYPISQAADITFCKADLVPVGEDQVPHIELAREIVRRFNRLYGEVLVEPEALVGNVPRLLGLDGRAKMGKSLNNCIFLSDPPNIVSDRVNMAITDPARIHPADQGHPDICTTYRYHQAFNSSFVPELTEACQAGKIGCVECKNKLAAALNDLLAPMRRRRAQYEASPDVVDEILSEGTKQARTIAKQTIGEVREAMHLNYF